MNLLPHVAGRIFSAPLMISHAKLEVILGVLMPRLQGEMLVPQGKAEPSRRFEVTPDGIAIIPIMGTLVRRTVGLDALSGLTSYAELSEQLMEAVSDPFIRAILLDIDSPGGEAGGVFDLADQIYAARQVKPVWAVANEEAFSAAYALAASAERLYVPRTGGVGSIGVIAVHLDQSEADAEEGLKYTAIFAGAHKDDYSPHKPLGAVPYDHIHAFCSASFFDALVTHSEVTAAYDRFQEGIFLRTGQARGQFDYAGIVFEEYRGGSGCSIDDGEARFFPVGVQGLFRQYNAPADFVETVNTIGLPRYAKQAVDMEFGRWVKLHTQANPLPICTRPKVLIKGAA